MAATLARSVRLNGVTIPAGTGETPELRAQITNPRAWAGDSEVPVEQVQAAQVAEVSVLDNDELRDLVAELVEQEVGHQVGKAVASLREELRQAPEPSAPQSAPAEASTTGQGEQPAPQVVEPPRGGRGSGEEAWRAYADAIGLDVTAANDRDEIIALVDARHSGS